MTGSIDGGDERPSPSTITATAKVGLSMSGNPFARIALLFVGVVLLSFLVLYLAADPLRFLPSFHHGLSPVKNDVELKRVLDNATMENKTVIITTVNDAWAEPDSILDVFLESFRVGDGTSKLVKHLDADIMWLRDPFKHFYPKADFQIACDHFIGDSYSRNNSPNGGFTFVRSNHRTILFYKFWYNSRTKYPGLHDQHVLNEIKNDTSITKEIGLKMRFLDTSYFGGFCEPSKDFNEVCTMHANCCVGLENKVLDLKIVIQDWGEFQSLPPNQKSRQSQAKWGVPQHCSMYYHPQERKIKDEQHH
ncbi:hypothetical protein HS088_TW16G00515 [Tripterygium wilfordii]|uniref:Nucleotide-diphospho-sugar transferase domain-containing protein n=1 Tax=Tripterygium wilfordii TaxID=458696 RepID=A0A7J7CJ27_TRIWF|nr:hypothetical protein HS088_TW16G00515 [Tripterygium wilfordii]